MRSRDRRGRYSEPLNQADFKLDELLGLDVPILIDVAQAEQIVQKMVKMVEKDFPDATEQEVHKMCKDYVNGHTEELGRIIKSRRRRRRIDK